MTKSEMLQVEVATRTTTGKEIAKKTRRAGQFPAVMYSKGAPAISLQVEERAFNAALHSHGAAHSVMKLIVDGSDKGHTVIVKSIQRHPVRRSVLHVDFQEVSMTEKIQAAVALVFVGQSSGIKAGGVLQQGVYEVMVEALPADIPEQIEVDISDIEIGGHLRVSDIPVQDKVTIVSNQEDLVVSIVAPRLAEEAPPTEAVEGEAEAEAEPQPTE